MVSYVCNLKFSDKRRCDSSIRINFFANRVINIWNSFLVSVNFASLSAFKSTVGRVDFSQFFLNATFFKNAVTKDCFPGQL